MVVIQAPWFQSKRSKSFRIPSLEENRNTRGNLMDAECTNDLKGGVKTTQVCKSNRYILKTRQLTHDSIWPNIRRLFWSLANYRIDIALATPSTFPRWGKSCPSWLTGVKNPAFKSVPNFFAFPFRHQERKVCIVTRYLDTKTQPIL